MVSGEVTKDLGLILANFGNIPFHFEDSFSALMLSRRIRKASNFVTSSIMVNY